MYLIKIDKRKTSKFDLSAILAYEEGRVYVDNSEASYTSDKNKARHFTTKEEAEKAIIADYEIVVTA